MGERDRRWPSTRGSKLGDLPGGAREWLESAQPVPSEAAAAIMVLVNPLLAILAQKQPPEAVLGEPAAGRTASLVHL